MSKELASAQENGEEERVDKLEKVLFDLKREQGLSWNRFAR
ncbi:MAG: hypothetical protein R2792_15005 [Saprospiraceae bacterium]